MYPILDQDEYNQLESHVVKPQDEGPNSVALVAHNKTGKCNVELILSMERIYESHGYRKKPSLKPHADWFLMYVQTIKDSI